MKRFFRPYWIAPLLLLFVVVGCQKASPEKQVEEGLLPFVPVKDWPGWKLEDRMAHYGVPGVSIAVIENFEIAWSQGYGTADEEGNPVTADTLFQAGSLSTTVAAVAALAKVQDGALSLDAPISEVLTSWQIPDAEALADTPVTLRHLLSHTAGTNVGFLSGYERSDTLPTLAQMLAGELPANSPPVSVDQTPGKLYRFSMGGMLILQQVLEDATGQPFAEVVQSTVLDPLGMTSSTLSQPPSAEQLATAAGGHLASGRAVPGRSQLYPELAASGLWTTAPDLAKLLIDLQHSARNESPKVLNAEIASEMRKPVIGPASLGILLNNPGNAPRYTMGGVARGFFSRFVFFPDRGFGAVVMTNSDNGRPLIAEILQAVAKAYSWPNYLQPEAAPIELAPERLDALAGRYGIGRTGAMVVTHEGDHLVAREVLSANDPFANVLVALAEDTFLDVSNGRRVAFRVDRRGQATAYTFQGPDGSEVIYPRLESAEPTPAELLESGKVEEAIAAFREVDGLQEARLNMAGYSLINQGKLDAATAIFELNAQLYPSSVNVYDSLADAYLAAGEKEKALEAVRKVEESLALDYTTPPALREVVEAKARYNLARLGG